VCEDVDWMELTTLNVKWGSCENDNESAGFATDRGCLDQLS